MYCKSYRSLGKLLGGDRDHHGHAMWVKVVKERQRKDCVVGVRETFQVRLVGSDWQSAGCRGGQLGSPSFRGEMTHSRGVEMG